MKSNYLFLTLVLVSSLLVESTAEARRRRPRAPRFTAQPQVVAASPVSVRASSLEIEPSPARAEGEWKLGDCTQTQMPWCQTRADGTEEVLHIDEPSGKVFTVRDGSFIEASSTVVKQLLESYQRSHKDSLLTQNESSLIRQLAQHYDGLYAEVHAATTTAPPPVLPVSVTAPTAAHGEGSTSPATRPVAAPGPPPGSLFAKWKEDFKEGQEPSNEELSRKMKAFADGEIPTVAPLSYVCVSREKPDEQIAVQGFLVDKGTPKEARFAFNLLKRAEGEASLAGAKDHAISLVSLAKENALHGSRRWGTFSDVPDLEIFLKRPLISTVPPPLDLRIVKKSEAGEQVFYCHESGKPKREKTADEKRKAAASMNKMYQKVPRTF